MEDFILILPQGFVLKHGTSFRRVDDILKKGLIAGSKRNKIRESEEWAPVVEGMSVAQSLSYYGALASFTSTMKEIFNERKNI